MALSTLPPIDPARLSEVAKLAARGQRDGIAAAIECFRQECRILHIVSHKERAAERFVKVLGVVESKHQIVMEKLGPSLFQTFCDLASNGKLLNERVRLRVIIEVAIAF